MGNKTKHRLLSALLAIVMVAALLPMSAAAVSGSWIDAGNVAASFAGGDGLTPGTAYQIATAGQLALLAKNTQAGTTYAGTFFELTADIDLAGHYWTPIGVSGTKYFSGVFEGKGHTVTGLNYDGAGIVEVTQGAGLFGWLNGATLRNLGVTGAEIIAAAGGADWWAGVFAGIAENTLIENCFAAGSISGQGFCGIGGFAAQNLGSHFIKNCYFIGSVSGTNTEKIGGFIGYTRGTVQNSYCSAGVAATGAVNAGSFTGVIEGGSIASCYYNSGQSAIGGVNGSDVTGQAEGKPETQMQDAAFVDTLNGSPSSGQWKSDIGINGGLPVLTWQGAAAAEPTEYDIGAGPINITEPGDYLITGTSTANTITVAADIDVDITLENVNIDVSNVGGCAFLIGDNSAGNVNITLAGTNVLKSSLGGAGLQKSGGAATGTLTIRGTGSLTANGGTWGAGIGGGSGGSGSNITISGGTVTATGGNYGAGIGGGHHQGNGSNITISGGTVTATGSAYSAGIGGGVYRDGSHITISGGTVTATGGDYGAGIGGGYGGSGSDITISGGTVEANGGEGGAGIGGGGNDISIAPADSSVRYTGVNSGGRRGAWQERPPSLW